ncbi:MAG: 50S ribosomal protein L37ae [DPANN group archaeon]|nr:50S ribosomal protein L37ae [DPANN group archaeon]
MARKKTKLGSASRYGPRYGSPLKHQVRKIEEVQRRPQQCPQCGRKSLHRQSNSVWACRKCNAVTAGGAYAPTTTIGIAAKRIVTKTGLKEVGE